MSDLAEITDAYERVRLIPSMVSVIEVAEMMGLEPNSSGKIASPYNQDERTPSCHLYETHFWDFSTGRGGDHIDLVQALTGCSWSQAVYQIWTRSLRAGREPGDFEREPRSTSIPDFTEELQVCDEVGWNGFHTKAMPKGVNTQRLVQNGYVLPGDGCILIPHYGPGRTCHGVKVRWFDGRKTAWSGSVFTHALYTARKWVNFTPQLQPTTAWLVEGESDSWALADCLSLRAEDVYALPSGASAWKDHWLETLDPYEMVVVCFDNDDAGKRATDKVWKKLDTVERLAAGGDVKIITLPPHFNDIRDAVIAGWTPPAILRSVR